MHLTGAHHIAPDAHGQNFYAIDRGFQDLLSLYLEPGLLKQMTPHFERLGALAGNRLDDLAQTAEEWVTARLARDAQIGTLWEGTSNINALDVVQRAVGKSGGHKTLTAALKAKYEPSGLPGQDKGLLGATLDRVERFAEAVAADPKHEKRARLAAGALYPAATAALLAWEGATLGAEGGDARRLLLSRLVIEHRLSTQDPLSLNESPWEQEAIDLLLADAPVPLSKVVAPLS